MLFGDAMVSPVIIALATLALAPIDTVDVEALLVHFDESGEEATQVLERLDELRRKPLDLNACSADDLLELPFITAAEAGAIVDHRRVHGKFPTPDALHAVGGVDAATINNILPYVIAGVATRRPRIRAELVQRWTRKLERADGFRRDSSGYLGSPDVLQTRLALSRGKISGRATFDKDAGEPMTWDVRKRSLGYDFIAGHLQLENAGWIRRLVVGDYSPRFAHGVLFRAPGNMSTAGPSGRGGAASLRPYASAAENGYFRGVGLEIAPSPRLALTAFVSRRRVDAAVDSVAGSGLLVVSRRTSGLHRTAAERANRAALLESTLGGSLQTVIGPVAIGAMFFMSEERASATSANRAIGPRLVSRSSYSAGAAFGRLYLAAEWSPGAGLSTSADVRSGRDSRFGVVIRHAPRAVYLPTSTLTSGSRGFTDETTDLTLHGRHRLLRTAILDLRLRHVYDRAPTDRRPFATISSAADVLLTHTPNPWFILTLRGTHRLNEDEAVCGSVRCIGNSQRQTIRFQLDYQHSRNVECRARAEYVQSGTRHSSAHSQAADAPRPTSTGTLLYEEIRIRPKEGVEIQGRLSVFSTDDHAARIWTYESDLRYAFSSPSFAGRGRRTYLLVRWQASPSLHLETKWSSTVLEDVKSIGAGRDEIHGRRVREIRMQIRLNIQ